MGAENPASEVESSQRSAKRSRVLLSARLRTPYGELDARLRDLSRKGALLECPERLPIGTEVVFIRNETIVPAKVAWAGPGRLGIEFLEPILESEVLVHVNRAPANQNQTRFRRPSFSEGLSDYDRKLARVLGASLGVSLIDE